MINENSKKTISQKNQDVIDNIFQSVSDPDDPNWGKFLTAKELYDIIRPDDGTTL